MPASSVSGVISTSLYFAAMFLLMAVVLGPVVSLYRDSSVAAATHLDQGIAAQIDGLSPGMKTEVEFGSFPGTSISVSFAGDNVTATVNGYSVSETVAWSLASQQLGPGKGYDVYLVGGVVQVE
jgi:hypothetical protein